MTIKMKRLLVLVVGILLPFIGYVGYQQGYASGLQVGEQRGQLLIMKTLGFEESAINAVKPDK